ncbi:MAG: GMP synthase [Saprospiraceae bacterium]
MKSLGILKADNVHPQLAPQFGEYPAMFTRIFQSHLPDLAVKAYDTLKFEYPTDLDEVDAYLITGSATSVYEAHAWIKQLGDFIKKLHAHRKKLIGICFGHQLIAHVLGGKTEKSDRGWGIGFYPLQLTDLGEQFIDHPFPLRLFYSHQDQVVVPAKGSKTLASSEFCPYGICKIDEHILTAQCHIEMPKAYGKALFAMRRERYGETLYQHAIQSMEGRDDTNVFVKYIIEFIWK